MTSEQRFEQELAEYLGQLSPGPTPDYRDDIVRTTARMRQRPAWTIPERWTPMATRTSRLTATPSFSPRLVALAALLIAAVILGGLLVAGSRPRVPAPFGPAANGAVAFDHNGDLFAGDPRTGAAVAITSGPDTDVGPVFSRDGTRIVFERRPANLAMPSELVVVGADGSHPVVITKQPHALPDVTSKNPAFDASYGFSPNGEDVMFNAGNSADSKLWLAKADGSGERQVDVRGMSIHNAAFLPTGGSEIVFTTEGGTGSVDTGNGGGGFYAVNTTTGALRTIVPPSSGVGVDWLRPSPDGSRIAYSRSTDDPDRVTYRVHVVNADGTNDIELPMPPGATFQDAPAWSNDGSRLAITRGYAAHNEDMVLAVVPADGSSTGVETKHGITGCCDTAFEWSPDDSTILVMPETTGDQGGQPSQQLLWDPTTGATSPAGWVATTNPAWQRVSR